MKASSISVITVTLNCADSISLTLESVKEQNCPNVEHIVIDGGSTDGTFELVKEGKVAHCVSEPDDGIYDAMEKGVRAALGDVLVFLNSGDVFFSPSTCREVLSYFRSTEAKVVFGDFVPYLIANITEYDHPHFIPDRICRNSEVTNRGCLRYRNLHHQSVFYDISVFDTCSYIIPEFPKGSDYILNVQALVREQLPAKYFPKPVSKFALGGVSTSNFASEMETVQRLLTYINDTYFSDDKVYPEQEYIFHRTADTAPKNSSIHLMQQELFNSLRQELGPLLNMASHQLNTKSSLQSAITEFRIRTDSIYEIVQAQNKTQMKLISELISSAQNLRERFEKIEQKLKQG